MNRLKRDIKQAFKAPAPVKKEEFLSTLPVKEMSAAEFVISQAGYVRKVTWLLFALIVILIAGSPFMLKEEAIWFISGLMPILALLAVSENSKSERYNMAELEASARFSLRSVLLARMVLLGGVNLAALLIAAPIGIWVGEYLAPVTGLFIVTPFFLSSAIGLYIVRKVKGQAAVYPLTAESFFISVLVLISRNNLDRYLAPETLKIWVAAAAVSLAAMVVQGIAYVKSTEEMTWSW